MSQADDNKDAEVLLQMNQIIKRAQLKRKEAEELEEPASKNMLAPIYLSEAELALNQITELARSLVRRKDKDYEEAWRYARSESHIDRIFQKVKRVIHLQDLEKEGKVPEVSEGIEQELIDIVNYAAFALYTIRNGHKK